MKKKKGSTSLYAAIGIGAVIGLLVALSDVIVLVVPSEREWITYALLLFLVVMTFRISILWKRSTNKENPDMDIDEIALHREKLAYNFIGSTSLFLIIGSGTLFLTLLEWKEQGGLFSEPIAYSLAAVLILFFYGFFAQMKAIKFHNEHNPGALINFTKANGYEEYFEKLDEGEKFEQYRVAYKSFYSMHLLFPATLLILFIISIGSSPQFLAIAIVSILWFVMYMIYYREGAKVYKQ